MSASSPRGRCLWFAGVLLVLSCVPPSPTATAQVETPFGGYEILATGVAFTIAPTVPAVLPVDTPVEGTLALATASLSTGGLGYGLASSVYPGTPIANLRPLLETGAGVSLPIPDYPIVVESREHEDVVTSRQPGINMRSDVDPDRSTASSDLGGFTLPGIIDVGSVRTVSTSTVDSTRAAASTVTEIHGIDILAGAIHIDTIETRATAETDSASASCGGGVTITGATVAGSAVTIDETGIHSAGATALPLVDLDEIVVDLLEATGIDIRVLGGDEACEGDHADRTTSGLLVSVPLPELGPVPPGGSLDVVFGSASARARATPAFEFVPPEEPSEAPTVADVVPRTPAPPTIETAGPTSTPPGVATSPTTTATPTVAIENEPAAYSFAGVPVSLVIGSMLLAVPGSRRIRRYLDRVTAMASSP